MGLRRLDTRLVDHFEHPRDIAAKLLDDLHAFDILLYLSGICAVHSVPVIRGNQYHLHAVHRCEQLLIGLQAARTAQRTQRSADLMVQLVIAASRRKHQAVEYALHAARNAAVINRRGKHNAIRCDALFDNLVDTVIILYAAQRIVVQAVIACHARMHFCAGLAYLKFDTLLLKHLAEHLEHLRAVAALARRTIDRYNLHPSYPPVCLLFIPADGNSNNNISFSQNASGFPDGTGASPPVCG